MRSLLDLVDLPLTKPAQVFLVLGLVILIAPLFAERLRLPGVIGLVVAGVAVGPEGLGLLERSGAIAQLGGVGILYLMFLAGLELDLDILSEHRRSAFTFGVLTFIIPITLGTASSLMLGYGTSASILIGSLWASHTLVAYPIIRRSGIVADPSVAATVGATVITDTLALLVLAVVAGSHLAGFDAGFVIKLVPGLAILAGFSLWVLPRIGAWFFTGLGQDRTLRFLFVLCALLGCAVLAEAIGIEGIVGAFLAGLSLNRLVPNGGTLMQRIEFVGSALFIPIFLVSVGMLVDLAVVLDPATLGLAAVFTGVAMGAKAMAAVLAGRRFGFDWPQIGVMFSLSNAQAAATLAATIVGFEIGLLDKRVVNAVLLVILVTVIVASWTAGVSTRRFKAHPAPPIRLGKTVVVPVANPAAAPSLVQLASWMAKADGGEVIPLHVATAPDAALVKAGRVMITQVVADAGRFGAEMEPVVRLDRSVSSGVVNTVLERDASLVLLGWKGTSTARDRLFGSLLDDIAESLPCVVGACWLPVGRPQRLVLANPGRQGLEPDWQAAVELFTRMARGSGLDAAIADAVDSDLAEGGPWPLVAPGGDLDQLLANLRSGDLLIMPAPRGSAGVGSAAQRLAAELPSLDLIVVHSRTPTTDFGVGEVFAGS